MTSRALLVVWRFRLRSCLISTSALLGVAGAICSVNYAAAGREATLDQMRRMGTNVLIVLPQQTRSLGGRARTGGIVTTLKEPDHRALRREIPSIVRSSRIVAGRFLVKARGLSKNGTSVVGCEPDYIQIKNWPIGAGQFFRDTEVRRSARVAVLGATVARDLFTGESPVGGRILVNRVPFEVIGVLAERGQRLDAANEDDQVYVPLTTAQRRLLNVDYYSGITFEVAGWEAMDDAAVSAAEILRRGHRAPPGSPDDFQVQSQKRLIDTESGASARLTFLVRWIGASALVVSGLGMLGVVWLAIKQRYMEIGTQRALGASARDIFLQVFFEAVVLSLAGSVFGVVVGWGASRTIAARAALPFVFDGANAMMAFAIAVALHSIFALLPARRAARLDPTDALKHE